MSPEDIINDIMRREGSSFTNYPADRGGPTKYGITLATLAQWRGHRVTDDDLEDMDAPEARAIYRKLYYLDPGFPKLHDDALAALAMDSAVQHGPVRVIKWIQQAVGVQTDGIIGNDTEKAIMTADANAIYRAVLKTRIEFYGEIIEADHSQAVFAHGWLKRVAEFVDYA